MMPLNAMHTDTPILTFHDLAGDRSPLAFPPALFGTLIDAIVKAEWQVVPLPGSIKNRGAARAAPQVILTFDDGYRSFYEHAYPLLQAHGIPATVFVTPSREDRLPDMYGRSRMSLQEICEVQSGGIVIGAHSLTHPDLTTLTETKLRDEIEGSQAKLEDRIGAPVRSFAYPFGRFDSRCVAAARECFDCAVTTDLRLASAQDDLFTLPRIEMAYFRHPLLLKLLMSRLLGGYLALRRGPRTLRQRFVRPT